MCLLFSACGAICSHSDALPSTLTVTHVGITLSAHCKRMRRAAQSSPSSLDYLYGMSLRLLWEWECGTRVSLIPDTANSCAEPERLRSLPRRFDRAPQVITVPCCVCCCCWTRPALGALLVDAFFFVGPNPKNLEDQKFEYVLLI